MIVGFIGKKQSGKSTAAKYLANKYDLKRVNFKDGLLRELKERCPDLLAEMVKTFNELSYQGITNWTVDGLFDVKPPLMRSLLQNYGTNVRRVDDPLHWIKEWRKATANLPGVVVDDVRFLNEADAIKTRSGILIRINRVGLESNDQHISEVEMDSIEPDFTITVQTGDFASLYSQVNEVIMNAYGEVPTPALPNPAEVLA